MSFLLSLGGLAAANLFLAFLIQGYIFLKIGPGVQTDALFAGMTVPQLTLSVLTGSLSHVLVPLLAGENEKQFNQGAWGFFLLIGGIFNILAVGLYVFAPYWVPLLVPGFSDEGKTLTRDLTRILLIGMIFAALAGVLRVVHYARQRFLWAEVSQLVETAVGFSVLIWALPKFGIKAAAWVTVLRGVVQMFLLLPGLGGYSKPDWTGSIIVESCRRITPLTLGTLYYKSGPLVDRFLSSLVPSGGLSLLYFGQQIYGTVSQIINKAAVSPIVPHLAVHAKAGDSAIFQRIYRMRLIWVIIVTAGIAIFLLSAAEPLLRIHKGISEENVKMLWWVMVALIGFFIGGATGQIVSSAFYAKGNVKTPMVIGIIGFTLGIAFKVVGFLTSGLVGIAIGTTLYYMLNVVALYFLLERELLVSR